ncbi:phosphopantetheine-binding protein [Streptomyces rubiginosohelvolus]|uniref:phosphopantetheine-binding protein n=1 Tax=Streptomyces rubiginosohelvolus TaxID=67362 RepID=UPI00365A949B
MTSATTWPDRFETVLREYLPLLPADHALDPEDSLTRLGLDSLGTVGLLVELEETFAVQIPDEDLTAATFATPSSLWAILKAL